MSSNQEEELLKSAALQNAHSIQLARQRTEVELVAAKDSLERKARELDRSVAMLRATLESTTDAILVTDGEGDVTDFNSHFVEMWGLEPVDKDNVRQANFVDASCKLVRDPRTFQNEVKRIFQESPPQSYDVLDLVDGRIVERFSRPQIIDGKAVGRVWSFRDISANARFQLALQESERQLQATFDQASVGIAMTDLSGRFLQANVKFCAILGYSMDELLRLTFLDITHPDSKVATRLNTDRLLKGEVLDFSYEKQYVCKDGRAIWSLTNIALQRNAEGIPIRYIGVIEDISLRKTEESERLRLLESERNARMDAENLSRLKDEFLATLSHELRTPLSAIMGWAYIIKSSAYDSEKVREGVEIIERNARLQSQLVEDLLDMSRIISGKMRLNMQPVELPELIEAAIQSIRPTAEAKGVRIESIVDPISHAIHGDPARLLQIFWNLLSNAVKFTPRDGSVQAMLRSADSHVEVIVADTGRGIKPEFLPYIFERFRQEDATTTRLHGGLGIGLALVKQLTDLHGGSLRAESLGEGQGTTVWVTLPAAATRLVSSEETPQPIGQ